MSASSPALPTRLIGHELTASILARAVTSGRVAHAYLFHGPASVGKRTAARLLASEFQCDRFDESAGIETLAPCGECLECRRVAAGTHPDVIEVHPDTSTGQSISVRQASAVVSNVALRPKTGRRRVFIVGRAELLGDEAANALLKTLEEPSPYSTLILCTSGVDRVLPTILSRCQPVRFDPVPTRVIEERLVADFGAEPEQALVLASTCAGRPGLAIRSLNDPSFLDRRGRTLDVFDEAVRARCEQHPQGPRAMLALRLSDALRAIAQEQRSPTADEGAPSGDATERTRPLKGCLAELLEIGQAYIRDILVLSSGARDCSLVNADRAGKAAAFGLPPAVCVAFIELLGETTQILDRNVPPPLALERMFLKFLLAT